MKSVFTRKKDRKTILRICSFAEMFAVKVIFFRKAYDTYKLLYKDSLWSFTFFNMEKE